MKNTINFIKKKRNILTVSFIFLIAICLTFIDASHSNTVLDEVRLKDGKKSMFAFMLENEDGEYTKSEDNMWPTKGYKYNQTLSGCIDGNNKEVKDVLQYNEETKKISVKTNSTIYCYLYFDKSSTGDKLLDEKTHGLNLTPVGDMYRFIGTASDEPNNYICFGKRGKCTLDSDYMYRIIGIEEKTGRIKLIKNRALDSVTLWHSGYVEDAKWDVNNGIEAQLHKDLNGDKFLNSNIYTTNDGWRNKISDINWYIGDISGNTETYVGTGENVLSKETSTSAITSSKIGLMYLSDYYYSLDGTGNLDCYNSVNASKCKSSWLHISNSGISSQIDKSEWSLIRFGEIGNTYRAWYIVNSGNIFYDTLSNGTYVIRPVFYLTAEQQIIDGTGEAENPFILDTSDIPLTESEQFIKDKLGNIPDNLVESDKGDLKYRFVGTKDEVTQNYICFGTTAKCSLTDDYMYRIIGIDKENRLKIIKNVALLNQMWHDSYRGTNGNVYWDSGGTKKSAQLYTNLNGDTFLNNYTYIPGTTWKNKISETRWNIGDVNGGEYASTGDSILVKEQGTTATTASKIGLMYLSDFYYSLDGTGSLNCYDRDNGTACRESWLHIFNSGITSQAGQHDWTMTRNGYGNGNYFTWYVAGQGFASWLYLNDTAAARPAFYLNSDIEISNGEGTLSNPYIIKY